MGRAIPESQLTVHTATARKTAAVLQTCEHYHQRPLAPRSERSPCVSHTRINYYSEPAVARKPPPFLSPGNPEFGMPSDKTFATLYPVYSVMPCPYKGAEKGAEEKNRPRLRPIMEKFHVSTPYWNPQCTQAVGSRVPKAGARVVFRTEPFSDIPPFRGAFTGFPTPFQGGRPLPHRGRPRRWASLMFREHVSQLETMRKFKKCTHGYGMCQFRSVISSAGPQSTRLTAR